MLAYKDDYGTVMRVTDNTVWVLFRLRDGSDIRVKLNEHRSGLEMDVTPNNGLQTMWFHKPSTETE